MSVYTVQFQSGAIYDGVHSHSAIDLEAAWQLPFVPRPGDGMDISRLELAAEVAMSTWDDEGGQFLVRMDRPLFSADDLEALVHRVRGALKLGWHVTDETLPTWKRWLARMKRKHPVTPASMPGAEESDE